MKIELPTTIDAPRDLRDLDLCVPYLVKDEHGGVKVVILGGGQSVLFFGDDRILYGTTNYLNDAYTHSCVN